jgi:hypothetical protein
MEKSQLITDLQKFTDLTTVSIDLYFVFKDGNFFKQYRTNPNDELKQEIIGSFVGQVINYANPTNPYELHDVYDDNEHEDFALFYDELSNNETSQRVFSFDKTEIDEYTRTVGEFSKVFGFLVELHNGQDTMWIFKRNQPTNAVSTRRSINIFYGQDNNLQLVQQDTVYITKSIDLMLVGDKVIIINKNLYESVFGLREKLREKAQNSFLQIVATNAFSVEESIYDKVNTLPPRIQKKLVNAVRDNAILSAQKFRAIITSAKKYANHTLKTEVDGKIILSTKKDLKILIKILNQDYVKNEITNHRFDSKSKKKIKVSAAGVEAAEVES